MLYSYVAIKCFCSLRHNQWNYRNVHLAGKNEVITIKEKNHLLIILYKYNMKGKDLIPIVARFLPVQSSVLFGWIQRQPEPPGELVKLSLLLWTKRGISNRI